MQINVNITCLVTIRIFEKDLNFLTGIYHVIDIGQSGHSIDVSDGINEKIKSIIYFLTSLGNLSETFITLS